jgi:transcriptional regulator with XRE-family HTH domain
MTSTTTDPEWTLADRLRKAREHAGLEQRELATEIGIGRSTIVSYEAGRTVPHRPVLVSWALRCGVSYEWLCDEVNVVRLKGKARGKARP